MMYLLLIYDWVISLGQTFSCRGVLPTQKVDHSSLARIFQWITRVSIASDPNQSQKNELSLFDSDDGGLAPNIPQGISRV